MGARRVELRQAKTWSALRARANRLRLRSLGVVLALSLAFPSRAARGSKDLALQASGPKAWRVTTLPLPANALDLTRSTGDRSGGRGLRDPLTCGRARVKPYEPHRVCLVEFGDSLS